MPRCLDWPCCGHGDSCPSTPATRTPSHKKATIGSYKGHPTITLDDGGKPFSFGLAKARLVLAHLPDIRKFVGEPEPVTPVTSFATASFPPVSVTDEEKAKAHASALLAMLQPAS